MTIKILRKNLTDREIEGRASRTLSNTIYSVTPGVEYQVIGIFVNQPYFGMGVQFQIVDDDGSLSWVPQEMAAITDPHVHPDWVIRRLEHSVALASTEMFTPYLHDDLSESVPEAKQLLIEMLSRYDAREELLRVKSRY